MLQDLVNDVLEGQDLEMLMDNNGGYWAQNEQYPVADWKYEVLNDCTRRGYWEWLAAKLDEGNG
jgi:hypothetical protein